MESLPSYDVSEIIAATVIYNGVSPVDRNGNVAQYPVLNIEQRGDSWVIRFVHYGAGTVWAYDARLDDIVLLTYNALAEFAHAIGVNCGLDIRGDSVLNMPGLTKDSVTYRLDPLP